MWTNTPAVRLGRQTPRADTCGLWRRSGVTRTAVTTRVVGGPDHTDLFVWKVVLCVVVVQVSTPGRRGGTVPGRSVGFVTTMKW